MQIYEWKSSLFYEDISPTAKLVGMAISEFYRKNKECFPSLPTILEVTGHTSINTIRKAIEELKESNLIEIKEKRIKGRGGKPVNSYVFVGVSDELSKNDSSSDISNDSSDELSKNDSEVTNKLEVTKVTNKKDTNVSTKVKLEFSEINNFDDLFNYWNENKKGGKYKNNNSFKIALDKLIRLTDGDFYFAKDVIENSIANGYQGFSRGNDLFLKKQQTEQSSSVLNMNF